MVPGRSFAGSDASGPYNVYVSRGKTVDHVSPVRFLQEHDERNLSRAERFAEIGGACYRGVPDARLREPPCPQADYPFGRFRPIAMPGIAESAVGDTCSVWRFAAALAGLPTNRLIVGMEQVGLGLLQMVRLWFRDRTVLEMTAAFAGCNRQGWRMC